eukprot:TRINITY_DN2815_c0_g1_i1.p1 TRINITY_DN2815_c0_g1~~TRINITY_DN2815_c0_g1_i1.p1  ORF type:complete len:451 (-),score=134.22 TRINITY_DN2815_c0_g1_i1:36-1388(-)
MKVIFILLFIIILFLIYMFVNIILLIKNCKIVSDKRREERKNKKNEDVIRVAFIHPDLGIGGAERLVVDAAVGLQSLNDFSVHVFTSHCSPDHSFSETQDGTLEVTIFGDFLPQTVFGLFKAPCAILRMIYVTIQVLKLHSKKPFDAYFIDQVSIPVPLIKLINSRVLFYCHYPDKLLVQSKSLLKNIYRFPLDFSEEITTGAANKVLVNSRFTKGIFKQSFKKINTDPDVLYPGINFESLSFHYENNLNNSEYDYGFEYFLSINRFERKKNIILAVKAFVELKNKLDQNQFGKLKLILAGGYDPLLPENKEVVEELKDIINKEDIENQVKFKFSCSDEEKVALISNALAVLYTPSNEHFGIVPVEVMYLKRPIIAVNSGGPTESVKHNETGYLCEPTSESFSESMITIYNNKEQALEMGLKGHDWAKENFSLEAFSKFLSNNICEIIEH